MTSTPHCPICKKPTDPKFRPFCSKGCKMIDLNRWLSGIYSIPGEPLSSSNTDSSDDFSEE
ncbi:MAG: DNA gyrase inhibitor YacG [Alphaproteobacteria bacterium]|nr:DNA gyrase inhibitor YacG [Alphaproteobacteria bacterium]